MTMYSPNRKTNSRHDVVERKGDGFVGLVAELPDDRMNCPCDTMKEASYI